MGGCFVRLYLVSSQCIKQGVHMFIHYIVVRWMIMGG